MVKSLIMSIFTILKETNITNNQKTKTMKYQVSKKGSSVTFKFATYEEAVDFCNTMIFLENARGAEYPELTISEIK